MIFSALWEHPATAMLTCFFLLHTPLQKQKNAEQKIGYLQAFFEMNQNTPFMLQLKGLLLIVMVLLLAVFPSQLFLIPLFLKLIAPKKFTPNKSLTTRLIKKMQGWPFYLL